MHRGKYFLGLISDRNTPDRTYIFPQNTELMRAYNGGLCSRVEFVVSCRPTSQNLWMHQACSADFAVPQEHLRTIIIMILANRFTPVSFRCVRSLRTESQNCRDLVSTLNPKRK